MKLGRALIDTLLPETQTSRLAARFLRADAAIRSHDGDIDGALDSARAIFGVSRSIGGEPFLISQLVKIAIDGDALRAILRALGQGEASDEALARVQAVILDELRAPLMIQGLRGERGMLDELIRRIRDAEIPIDSLSGMTDAEVVPEISPWGKLTFDYQRALGLEWSGELLRIARQPIKERPALLDAWEAEMDRVRQTRFGLYTATLPLLMMPAARAVFEADARRHGELGAMALLIASERHRRKTGAWPRSIDEIAGLLPAGPLDPFTGENFLILHQDGRFRVHSVGPDLEDDQGAYDPKTWMHGGPDDVGEALWDVDRRKQPAGP